MIKSVIHEEKYKIKSIYNSIVEHWSSWFPNLPSYQQFNKRLNQFTVCFELLSSSLIEAFNLEGDLSKPILGDSMPIITCAGNRKPQFESSLIAKGYCATKKLYYYGCKLHLLSRAREHTIPFPNVVSFTLADTHDLTALRDHI